MERERAAARFTATKPKLAAYTGLGLAALCREYIAQPEPALRAAILSTPLTTKADAIAALSVIESDGEDRDAAMHLIAALRVYFSAA